MSLNSEKYTSNDKHFNFNAIGKTFYFLKTMNLLYKLYIVYKCMSDICPMCIAEVCHTVGMYNNF